METPSLKPLKQQHKFCRKLFNVSLYCLLLIVTVSCVPNVVSVSVFSNIDCHCFLCAQCCLSLYSLLLMETVTINNKQCRDTDNIGHTGNSHN
jgi:hypothetical protein